MAHICTERGSRTNEKSRARNWKETAEYDATLEQSKHPYNPRSLFTSRRDVHLFWVLSLHSRGSSLCSWEIRGGPYLSCFSPCKSYCFLTQALLNKTEIFNAVKHIAAAGIVHNAVTPAAIRICGRSGKVVLCMFPMCQHILYSYWLKPKLILRTAYCKEILLILMLICNILALQFSNVWMVKQMGNYAIWNTLCPREKTTECSVSSKVRNGADANYSLTAWTICSTTTSNRLRNLNVR